VADESYLSAGNAALEMLPIAIRLRLRFSHLADDTEYSHKL
jgi:hypothetical protein